MPFKPDELDAKLRETRTVLRTLIFWMSQSANSPISHSEATELLKRLGKDT